VLEAFGAYGRKARHLCRRLRRISSDDNAVLMDTAHIQDDVRNAFCAISVALQRGNSALLREGRSRTMHH
jgi:hypothetical protein